MAILRVLKVGLVPKRASFIALLFFLLSCNEDSTWLSANNEQTIITSLVYEMSEELGMLGFPIDPHEIQIKVMDKETMATVYNHIDDKSRPEMEDFLKTPSIGFQKNTSFRDGTESKMAFYDPNTKTIIFEQGAAAKVSKAQLAHELAHVFEDQKWGYGSLWRSYQKKPSRELYSITHYLLEGYAELVREAYEQSQKHSRQKEVQRSFILSKLYDDTCVMCITQYQNSETPYTVGQRFLLHEYKKGGWAQVERNMDILPSSTEVMLHPKKKGKDEPISVELATWDPKTPQVERVAEGCMGEAFLFSKLLSLSMKPKEAFIAAAGWDGDIAHVYKNEEGDEVLLWRIVFDSDHDARQLERSISYLGMSKNVMKQGRIVDWIITDNDELLKKSRIFMSKHPMSLEKAIENDRKMTEREERNFDLRTLSTFYPTTKISVLPRWAL